MKKIEDIAETPDETKDLVSFTNHDNKHLLFRCADETVYLVGSQDIARIKVIPLPGSIQKGSKITVWGDVKNDELRGLAVDGDVLFYREVDRTRYHKVSTISPDVDKYDEELVLKNCSESEHQGKKYWNFDCKSSGFSVAVSMFDNQLPMPKEGDKIQLWGSWGKPLRGIGINGDILFYRSPAEQNVIRKEAAIEQAADDMKQFLAAEADHDARIKKLPTEFQQRFEGYHKAGGKAWRAKYEAYELFCCEQAMAMVEHFLEEAGPHYVPGSATPGAAGAAVMLIREWAKLKDWKQQKAEFPALDEGHSGNTFGHSIRMACAFLENPTIVHRLPLGISPLVGSEEALDWVVRPENAEEVARMRAEEASRKENPENLHEP